MNKKNAYDSFITVCNTFKIEEVEQLIKKCNYTPYYDNPDADDLIQFAAYTYNHKFIGFISCVLPEFLYNDSNLESIPKTVEIEITSIVDPEFRSQKVFSTLFSKLKLYIASCCDYINIPMPHIKYITANSEYQDKNIDSTFLKYSHSEYLMSLIPSDINEHINNYTDNYTDYYINDTINSDTNPTIVLCADNKKNSNRLSINQNILDQKYIVNKNNEEYKLINTLDNTVITSISYSIYDNSICIHDVITRPYYRRTGCARYLLSVMICELSSHNNDHTDYKNADNNCNNTITNSFILHVSGRNTAAVNLYTSMGFKITEEIKYYVLS